MKPRIQSFVEVPIWHVDRASRDLIVRSLEDPGFDGVTAHEGLDRTAFVYAHDEWPDGWPTPLTDLFVWARNLGCDWIRFEIEGLSVDGLPVFTDFGDDEDRWFT